MERLTIRRDHGITMAPGYDFGIDPDDYDLVQEILNRLAQYEDTGLEPEEVEIMRESKADAQFMLTELCRLCDYDLLEELAKAEKDGRLVVLPCKPGDTVYFLLEDSPVYYPETNGWYISAEEITAVSTQGFFTGPIEQIDALSFCSFDEFGKTVFLTHEEAEAALERKMEGKADG